MSGILDTGNFPTPAEALVMVLSNAHLFPHSLMPLYIFEQRYRDMLRYALERDRMWVIACPKDAETEDLHSVAGLGLIRACVQNADGTSHLVMQGIRRIRMRSLQTQGSFRVAQIDPVQSVQGPQDLVEVLNARLLTCVAKLKAAGNQLPAQFEQQLSAIESPEIVADIISAALVADTAFRQALLEQVEVSKRLEQLLEWFE
jgi:Lon protease-like protein